MNRAVRALTPLILSDPQDDGSFGKFFGHPGGPEKSKAYVARMLAEFGLTFPAMRETLERVRVLPGTIPTKVEGPLRAQLVAEGWLPQPKYPEAPPRSAYKADFGIEREGRWLFLEVELSDIRRNVSALYMSRAFRTGYLRLGIVLAPSMKLGERRATFYSSIATRYEYLAPDFPVWIIGFDILPSIKIVG